MTQIEMTDMDKVHFTCRRLAQRPAADVRNGHRQAGDRGRQPKLPGRFNVELPAAEAAA